MLKCNLLYNVIVSYLQVELADVRPTWVNGLYFLCSSIQFYVLLSPYLCFISFLYLNLYVLGDKFMDKLCVFHANQTSMCLDPHLN